MSSEFYEQENRRAKDHTEWLRQFQAAHGIANNALDVIASMVANLHDVGLESIALKFDTPLQVAAQAVRSMDDAVGRSIDERLQDARRNTDETLVAVLRGLSTNIK